MSESLPSLTKRALQVAAFTVGSGVALAFAMAGSAHADTVAGQAAPVANVGAGAANSGGNAAVGNASQNTATTAQGAVGIVAANQGSAANNSNGSATIHTGNATGIGNVSSTNIGQAVVGGGGPGGLTVAGQLAPVLNAGVGLANTGLNGALGNGSTNSSTCLQGALGVIASNTCLAGGGSNGTAIVHTGNATGIGNTSSTNIGQSVAPAGIGGLKVVGQAAPVANLGIGIANSGLNAVEANDSLQQTIIAQVAFGLLANNVALPAGWSDGFAMVISGNATGIGNQSSTKVWQIA